MKCVYGAHCVFVQCTKRTRLTKNFTSRCCFCFCCLRVSFNFQFALLCTPYTTASHPRGVLIFLLLLLLLKFFPHIQIHAPSPLQPSNFSYIHTYNGVIRTYFSECLCKKLQATNWRGRQRQFCEMFSCKII